MASVDNEELLSAWLRFSLAIRTDKVVETMPYNEALVCHLLYKAQLQEAEQPVTATDLCQTIHMQKSQMNRVLASLEEKNYITRTRSEDDKRRVYLHLNTEKAEGFLAQHRKTLAVVATLADRYGPEKTPQLIDLFETMAAIAEEVFE